jgi:hypothetical protein
MDDEDLSDVTPDVPSSEDIVDRETLVRLLGMVRKFHGDIETAWISQYGDTVSASDIAGHSEDEVRALIMRFTIRFAIDEFFRVFNPDNPRPRRIKRKPMNDLLENILIQMEKLSKGGVYFT